MSDIDVAVLNVIKSAAIPGGVLPYIDYTGMCLWSGYGFQAFEFRTGYINQENNVGNRVYNYIKLINSLIQAAINFLERHMDTYRIRVILFSGIPFRTRYQNQAKSSLEQGQVSGGPAAHLPQNLCSVPSPPFRICLPKKITAFFSIPKTIPLSFFHNPKNPSVCFFSATQKYLGVFHRPKKITFAQNFKPKKITQTPPPIPTPRH